MKSPHYQFVFVVALALGCCGAAFAGDASPSTSAVCEGFGPQTPRDIDSAVGTNSRIFPTAPAASALNLCNVHFHVNAEHRAEAFSIPAMATGTRPGVGGGFRCAIGETLTDAERAVPEVNKCQDVQPGDTIEVHWVHSSCDLEPGPTLGACVPAGCESPALRVETQVFVLVNDSDALDFSDFALAANKVDGLHQAKGIPSGTGDPVVFLGSTTGPSYDDSTCSPVEATWSVRPQCAKLDIASLSEWCEDNVFDESKAHGVRELVTNPKLLSTIGAR